MTLRHIDLLDRDFWPEHSDFRSLQAHLHFIRINMAFRRAPQTKKKPQSDVEIGSDDEELNFFASQGSTGSDDQAYELGLYCNIDICALMGPKIKYAV